MGVGKLDRLFGKLKIGMLGINNLLMPIKISLARKSLNTNSLKIIRNILDYKAKIIRI